MLMTGRRRGSAQLVFFDIDIQTAFRLRAIADVLVACLFLLHRPGERLQHPVKLFIAGQLINASGMILISLRGTLPLLLSAHLGNLLAYLGVALGMFAFALVCRAPHGLKPLFAGIAGVGTVLFLGVDLLFPGHTGSGAAYVAISSIVIGSLYGLGGQRILGATPSSRLRRVIGTIFIGLALCFFGRAYLAMAEDLSVFVPHAVQSLTLLAMLMATILCGVGFMLMMHEETEQALRQAASTDPLTGLANRRRFTEVLGTEFYRLKRSGAPLSLIMLDIDHFKRFNDRYGHVQGDECLRRVGGAIRAAVHRASDLPARFGSEEFIVIAPETDAPGARALAENIRRAIEALAIPHEDNTAAPRVTASLGVVTRHAAEVESPESLASLADQALYRAKENGRNRTEVQLRQEDEFSQGSRLAGLTWREIYQSGHPTLDAEHRALFDQANRLLSAAIDGQPRPACRALLDETIDLIAAHFASEEAILAGTDFPQNPHHLERHRELLAKARALSAQFDRGELYMDDLFGFVAYDVVARHILSEDRKFFPYLQARRPRPPPEPPGHLALQRPEC